MDDINPTTFNLVISERSYRHEVEQAAEAVIDERDDGMSRTREDVEVHACQVLQEHLYFEDHSASRFGAILEYATDDGKPITHMEMTLRQTALEAMAEDVANIVIEETFKYNPGIAEGAA